MVIIKDAKDIDDKLLSEFVFHHSRGNIFNTPELYNIYTKTKNYTPVFLTAVDEDNNILGCILCIIQKEDIGFFSYFTSRSIVWGAPLIKNDDVYITNLLLKELVNKTKHRSIYIQIRNLWNTNEISKSFLLNKFKYIEHCNILFDLNESYEALFSSIHKGRRKNIRRAERMGIILDEVSNNNEFDYSLSLIKKTYKRINHPFPDESFFKNAKEILSDKKMIRFFVLKLNDEIISTRFVLCYKNLVYDWYAGTDAKHLDKYPNDIFPWEIIKWSKKNGYSVFDFGGAGKSNEKYGVRDYKLKFGGEFVNWGRFEKIHNFFLFKSGKLGLKIWKSIKM